MVERISIVVNKGLSAGQKANVAAIIMGQLALSNNQVYENEVMDIDNTIHVGIQVNVIILESTESQLISLINDAKKSNLNYYVFTRIGQELSNSFSVYKEKIYSMNTINTGVVGVGVFGCSDEIKNLTKKFRLSK